MENDDEFSLAYFSRATILQSQGASRRAVDSNARAAQRQVAIRLLQQLFEDKCDQLQTNIDRYKVDYPH